MQQDNIVAIAPKAAPSDAATRDGRDDLEALTFDLDGETFALEASLVREIVERLPQTAVPGAPALAGHVANFRGRIVPVVDLRLAFGMAPSQTTVDSRIIVIEPELRGEPTLLGLRTDKVHAVVTLPHSSSEAPPAIGMRWPREHVHSFVRWHGDLIVRPDLKAILEPAIGGP